MTTPLAAKIAREYGTPCAVIDMDRVERNIARIQKACEAAGVANRPHIKTHKSPLLAKMQIAAGASGITCQKLGEAEVMAEAGIDDILISYNLIGDEKMARLGALQRKANMTVAADNSTVIAGLPKAAETSGQPLAVVVECDTGRKRAGVETPAEAVRLAREIAQGGPHALAECKRLIADVAHRGPGPGLAGATAEWLAILREGREAQEGVEAALERRPPRWRA